jgi:rhodanese-related sulfurtransferase
MGSVLGNQNFKYVNYRELAAAAAATDITMIINTLPENKQTCLIKNTVPADQEVKIVDFLLDSGKYDKKIIVYGENCTDKTPEKKAAQLANLGFTNINIYSGGLFEWLLIQDIYGAENFPTTSREKDILKYAGIKVANPGNM